MYIAFNENREFTTSDIMKGLNEIIPLAQLEKEKNSNFATMGALRAYSNSFFELLVTYEITICPR